MIGLLFLLVIAVALILYKKPESFHKTSSDHNVEKIRNYKIKEIFKCKGEAEDGFVLDENMKPIKKEDENAGIQFWKYEFTDLKFNFWESHKATFEGTVTVFDTETNEKLYIGDTKGSGSHIDGVLSFSMHCRHSRTTYLCLPLKLLIKSIRKNSLRGTDGKNGPEPLRFPCQLI